MSQQSIARLSSSGVGLFLPLRVVPLQVNALTQVLDEREVVAPPTIEQQAGQAWQSGYGRGRGVLAERDRSNGWENVANRLIEERSRIGAAMVRNWCRSLPTRAAVLDLGCGAGVPVSEVLTAEGHEVYAIDASPSLVAAFQQRFPDAHVACEPVEESHFFGRCYDGILAIGLMFLLQPDVQRAVIRRVAAALNRQGRFLFTAPTQVAAWADAMTGLQSVSLGDQAYRRAVSDAGLVVIGEYFDEGESHYYDVGRP